MTRETSTSLLARIRVQPDPRDWRYFAELYDPLIRGWLRRQQVSPQDADDITQEVMAVVIRRVSDFEHNGRTGAFRTWLRTITVNCIRDFWRAQRNKPAGLGGSDMVEFLAQLEDPQSEASRIWDQEHDRQVMKALLERLRHEFEAKTWQAFEMFALQGIPAATVAQQLGLTSNAVFIAKSRIMAKLRQESAGILDEI